MSHLLPNGASHVPMCVVYRKDIIGYSVQIQLIIHHSFSFPFFFKSPKTQKTLNMVLMSLKENHLPKTYQRHAEEGEVSK